MSTQKERQKALSWGQAKACEEAEHPQCRCRCGGALHGARRTTNVYSLPLDDPHYPVVRCRKCKDTGIRRMIPAGLRHDVLGLPRKAGEWSADGKERPIYCFCEAGNRAFAEALEEHAA